MIEAPWCRVTGRVIGPDAAPHGVGGQVIFDPDPERVFAEVVEGEAPAIVATRVVCVLDEDGYITSSAGRFVDLVAPGPGVLPGGEWTYRMTVLTGSGQWASRMFEHVTLTQGAVVDLADLVPAATYQGDAVTIAEGAAQESAASAEAAAESAQAAALSAEEAEASASQAAADLATVRGEVQSGIHDGVGVSSITDDDGDGTATVTLTDGSTSDLILPRGPQGTGVSSITNADGDATALVTLTDGSTADLALPTVATPAFTVSASTLAAGSQATAKLSGAYPNLAIGLGIPAGATGSPSATQIIGAGRPDVASSMDANTRALVNAAPPGSTFNSTDGAGTGAWAWQKTAAGWVVTMGDTGKRDITSLVTSFLSNYGNWFPVYIRRIGPIVYLTSGGMNATTPGTLKGSSVILTLTLPPGFTKAATAPIAMGRGRTNASAAFAGSQIVLTTDFYADHSSTLSGMWMTSDLLTWPTSVPGTPA